MLRLLGFLTLLLIIGGGVAYYRGWFDVETAQGGDGKSLTVNINEGKAKDDLEKGKEAAGGLLDKGKEAGGSLLDKVEGAIGGSTVAGTARKVNTGNRRIRVQPDAGGDEVAIHVPSDDMVRRNGASSAFASILEGDRVTVAYVDKDGQKIATKVEATGS